MRTILLFLILCSPAFAQRHVLSLEQRKSTHEQIVRIECHYHGRIGYGSGIVLSPREVVTALHCIRNNEIKIHYKGEQVTALVDRVNFYNDWALLRLTRDVEAKHVNLRASNLEQGEQVIGLGYGPPGGVLCWYASKVVDGELEGQQPVGGDSGGPILDKDGLLCGIISDKDEPGVRWRGYSLGKKFTDWIRN